MHGVSTVTTMQTTLYSCGLEGEDRRQQGRIVGWMVPECPKNNLQIIVKIHISLKLFYVPLQAI
jgi:hypothetical protein